MVNAAGGRPIIDMGSRRTHEGASVDAARAAYLVGFASTSNLQAGYRYGIPTAGTAAHAFTLLHADEPTAFAAQIAGLGAGTTLVVDTYDITTGVRNAVAAGGPNLGAVRIDSGDLGVLARQVRAQLDGLGNPATRIVVSGDLDEFAIAALAAAPVDAYGAGTAVVTGSGAPTAGLVYKLVEVDGHPVAKRSDRKQTTGGAKAGYRAHRASGTATDELVVVAPAERRADVVARLAGEHADVRLVTQTLVERGKRTDAGRSMLDDARARHRAVLTTLPWESLSLTRGEPALPTELVRA
jgi:nicotinate phosphoribosyltransferase